MARRWPWYDKPYLEPRGTRSARFSGPAAADAVQSLLICRRGAQAERVCGAGYFGGAWRHPRDRAVRADRRVVLCAGPHRGRAAGACSSVMFDRDARSGTVGARSGGAVGSFLCVVAQGRGLLGELGADGGVVRCRRSRDQADVQAGGLVAAVLGVCVVAENGRVGQGVARAGGAAAGDPR